MVLLVDNDGMLYIEEFNSSGESISSIDAL